MPKAQPRHKPGPATEPPRWNPLPPPRQNRPLLVVASLLVAAWIAFLLYLALGT
jgi:hypothetical protein